MAEALGLISVSLGLLEAIANITAGRFPHAKEHLGIVLGELDIHKAILEEAMSMIQAASTALPYSGWVALEKCSVLERELEATLQSLGFIPKAGKKPSVGHSYIMHLRRISREERLRQVIAGFRNAVLLLRDIASDAVTHDLLRRAYASDDGVNELDCTSLGQGSDGPEPAVVACTDDEPGHGDSKITVTTTTDDQKPLETTRDAPTKGEKKSLARTRTTQKARIEKKPPAPDPHLFNGTICFATPQSSGGAGWYPVRGLFDTGSHADLVSREVLREAGIEDRVKDAPTITLESIQNTNWDISKSIKLSWQLHNGTRSFITTFYVVDAAPFDVLIGKLTLRKHRPDKDNHSFLTLKLRWRTQAERQLEDQVAADRANDSLTLEEHRRALEKQERDQRRLNLNGASVPATTTASRVSSQSASTGPIISPASTTP